MSAYKDQVTKWQCHKILIPISKDNKYCSETLLFCMKARNITRMAILKMMNK